MGAVYEAEQEQPRRTVALKVIKPGLASPELLYFKDMDGDGKADVHQLVFTGFGNLAEKLNVQQLPNSLQWGPDQR